LGKREAVRMDNQVHLMAVFLHPRYRSAACSVTAKTTDSAVETCRAPYRRRAHEDRSAVLCARRSIFWTSLNADRLRKPPSIFFPLFCFRLIFWYKQAVCLPEINDAIMVRKNDVSKKGATSSHTTAAHGGCLQHNRRTQLAQNVFPERTKFNESWEHGAIEKEKSLQRLQAKARKLYEEKVKQKCQKSFTPFKESCVVIKDNSTLEEAKKFALMVEEGIPGIECYGIWIHRDEGHYRSKYIEGDENFQCNVHAHFLWRCQNPNTGKAIPIKRQDLRNMQDWAAEAFGMERGNPAKLTQMKHIGSMEYKTKKMNERIDELQETCKEKQVALDEMQTSIDELQKDIDKISASKEAKKAFIESVKSLFGKANWQQEEKSLKDKINGLTAQINILTEQNKRLSEQNRTLSDNDKKYEKLYQKYENLYQKNCQLKNTLKYNVEQKAAQIISSVYNIPEDAAKEMVDRHEYGESISRKR